MHKKRYIEQTKLTKHQHEHGTNKYMDTGKSHKSFQCCGLTRLMKETLPVSIAP